MGGAGLGRIIMVGFLRRKAKGKKTRVLGVSVLVAHAVRVVCSLPHMGRTPGVRCRGRAVTAGR
jgi:hypothetical protein